MLSDFSGNFQRSFTLHYSKSIPHLSYNLSLHSSLDPKTIPLFFFVKISIAVFFSFFFSQGLDPFHSKWPIMTLSDHGVSQVSKLKVTKRKRRRRRTPDDLRKKEDLYWKTLGLLENYQEDHRIGPLWENKQAHRWAHTLELDPWGPYFHHLGPQDPEVHIIYSATAGPINRTPLHPCTTALRIPHHHCSWPQSLECFWLTGSRSRVCTLATKKTRKIRNWLFQLFWWKMVSSSHQNPYHREVSKHRKGLQMLMLFPSSFLGSVAGLIIKLT